MHDERRSLFAVIELIASTEIFLTGRAVYFNNVRSIIAKKFGWMKKIKMFTTCV